MCERFVTYDFEPQHGNNQVRKELHVSHVADVMHRQIDLHLDGEFQRQAGNLRERFGRHTLDHLNSEPKPIFESYRLNHHERTVLAPVRLGAQHILANFLIRLQEMRIAERNWKAIVAIGHVQQAGRQAGIWCSAEAFVALVGDAIVHEIRLELVAIGRQLANLLGNIADAMLQTENKAGQSLADTNICFYNNALTSRIARHMLFL